MEAARTRVADEVRLDSWVASLRLLRLGDKRAERADDWEPCLQESGVSFWSCEFRVSLPTQDWADLGECFKSLALDGRWFKRSCVLAGAEAER